MFQTNAQNNNGTIGNLDPENDFEVQINVLMSKINECQKTISECNNSLKSKKINESEKLVATIVQQMVSLVTEKNTLNDRYKDLEITSKPRYKLRVDYVDKFLSDVQRDFNELHSQIKVAISIDQAASRQNAQKDGFMMLMQEEEIQHNENYNGEDFHQNAAGGEQMAMQSNNINHDYVKFMQSDYNYLMERTQKLQKISDEMTESLFLVNKLKTKIDEGKPQLDLIENMVHDANQNQSKVLMNLEQRNVQIKDEVKFKGAIISVLLLIIFFEIILLIRKVKNVGR